MREFVAEKSARLDIVLSEILQTSRSQISSLIKSSSVFINEKPILKPSFKVELGDKIKFKLPDIKEQSKFEVDFDIEILYEDDDLLIINKPINLTIHQAPSVKDVTLVDWLRSKNYSLSTLSGEVRAGIVHRLDKGTSGVMAVAKTNFAHQSLSNQLQNRDMTRLYLALINLPLKENLVIDKPIARSPSNRLKNAVVKGGRDSKSAFLNLLNKDEVNLIAAKLFTGRTHQIRVHLASINRHILGDNLYGFKSLNGKIARIMLHAYVLSLIHPRSQKFMEFKANLDGEFLQILTKNFNKEILDEAILPSNISSHFSNCDKWLCCK